MGRIKDEYDEFFEEGEINLSWEEYKSVRKRQRQNATNTKRFDTANEIGPFPEPAPEILERRKLYETDYVSMHADLFPRSTGIKPFGPIQIESIKRTQHVLNNGGRSIIVEPRGFGKTSRTSNNALMAVLQGKIRYALILASSVTKADDILDAIKTELIDNERLAELYPATCRAFEHINDNPARAVRQTINGKNTHISCVKSIIKFPVIEGEPSSGSIIQVRTKDNVRGISVKIRFGEESGRVLRPDFVFMDDIQTDIEASSPTSVYSIITTIKKSILFAGSHSKPISAVMCCTPICPGDVVSHFVLNEPSWDCVVSKMVNKMPDKLDMWLNDYAKILLDFDRYDTGSRLKARLRARAFVEANYDEMHQGAEVAWDWAYGWAEDPVTEVSALQHAMNFLIQEGTEAFESECQCNISLKENEAEGVRATLDEIINKIHQWPRYQCPSESQYICTHVDVNKNVLTYATLASPIDFRPMLINLGEWPEQKGSVWKKRDIVYDLPKTYPDVPEEHELIYVGLKDLLNKLYRMEFKRDDGVIKTHDLILVDMRYRIDEVQRAIRDSNAKPITMCYAGQGIGAKDRQFMDKHYEKGSVKHFHCASVPSTDKTLMVLYTDVNYFKSAFHKGIKTREGIGGSLSLFTPERAGGHLLYAKHCTVERPEEEHNEKENLTVIRWYNDRDEDNEYFDNTVGAMAGLFKLGCQLRSKKRKSGTFSMQDYINQQKRTQ